MKYLIIEDDAPAASAMRALFREFKIDCDTTSMGVRGLEYAKFDPYELILLDLMLQQPGIDGFEVIRRLRRAQVKTPILVVSGCADSETRIQSIALGADDFIVKPYEPKELMVRAFNLVRRAHGHASSTIRTGGLSVNIHERTVRVHTESVDTFVDLTEKEYKTLECLSLRMGSTLSKESILNYLYGGRDEPELKIIDVFVCKIRKKLGEALLGNQGGNVDHLAEGGKYIKTIWGRGYVLTTLKPEIEEEEDMHDETLTSMKKAMEQVARNKNRTATSEHETITPPTSFVSRAEQQLQRKKGM